MGDVIDLDSKHLHARKRAGVLTVRIDRPERRNALTIEMYHGIKKACVVAERDPEIDVVVGSRYAASGSVEGWDRSRLKISRLATRLAYGL